jgi:ParB-like chromosome segregation protein Spo0J
MYIVVDGFHRYLTLKTSKRIFERENGMLPCVVLDKEVSDRMASTIRHNRARGSHNIELMSNIVAELVEAGMSDQWIIKHIGMDRAELLRLKQITGLASLFKDVDFTEAFGIEKTAGIKHIDLERFDVQED